MEVFQALDVGFCRDHQHSRFNRRLADPAHLGQVKFAQIVSGQLPVHETRIEATDRQAVGVGGIDHLGADEMAGAGNVLHDDLRTWQIFFEIACHQPPHGVVTAARFSRYDISDRFAVEEIALRDGGVQGP